MPAQDDPENWHAPDSLYAPYRADAFRSQALVLDFRTTARLERELLEDLGISTKPETELVIRHLRHCMVHGDRPHILTYQILNERAQDADPLVSTLAGTECIHEKRQGKFVRTNQVFRVEPHLGRYAFKIHESYDSFTPLFRALRVKDAPERSDYIDIVLDLVGAHFERAAPVVDADRAIYETCIANVAAAHQREECDEAELQRLAEAPVILNLSGMTTHPDDILLHDSKWHADFFDGDLDQALCRLPPEHWPLFEELGVERLSDSARILLEYVGGEERDETDLARKLRERSDIFARLLHDKPTAVRDRVRDALSEIEAVSYAEVRIEASVQLAGDAVRARPTRAPAFYEIDGGQLTVCRPVEDRSWFDILNAIFHQLMPGATGSEISKLTLGIRPLMAMTVDDAHRELTDAGVPRLDADHAATEKVDLTSQELDELGAGDDQADSGQTDGSPATGENENSEAGATCEDNGESSGEEGRADREGKGAGRGGQPPTSGSTGPRRKARGKHKEQWDRRLLSYVRQQLERTEGRPASTEHNLAVEVLARGAVCAYEKERGRNAQQMAQGHPGHDIVSNDPLTGEERLIEVKGIDGEWNQTGVGLSRTQFSNAQDYGDRYWLYVVEFASDPNHSRIHPIRNPAMQVTSFMFDGKWREAATDESPDPTKLFIPGVRVHHESMGAGEILDVVVRGNTKLLTIQFEGRKQAWRNMTLNLRQMRVLEDDDGDDNP